jgi:hypothetical protein
VQEAYVDSSLQEFHVRYVKYFTMMYDIMHYEALCCYYRVFSADVRKQRMFFSHWQKVVQGYRRSEQSREHGRILQSLNSVREKKERDLFAAITAEREKASRMQDEMEANRLELNKMTAITPK